MCEQMVNMCYFNLNYGSLELFIKKDSEIELIVQYCRHVSLPYLR